MSKTILYFKNEDVMKPQPWPVAYDIAGIVTSGLGPDDGAFLVGFGPVDEFRITVLRADATPENVLGLAPTFSAGGHFFKWALEVRELVTQ